MHTVRPDLGGDGRIVVHDEERTGPGRHAAQLAPLAQDILAGGVLHAELHYLHASPDGGLRALRVADDRVGYHKIEPEVRHLPRSLRIICAILRPLLNMPPNIGPMRNPPWALFAAIPEA